jgi:tetratricopeptide (TPR) repeat protein
MRARILLALGATLAASIAIFFGGVLDGPEAGRSATPPQLRTAEATSFVALGLRFQQQARETGDPSFYPRSQAALVQAVRLDPRNPVAVTGLSALAASRHRFEEARNLAERARRLAPQSADALGVLGDALVELGRYRQAFTAFDRMVALRPSLASYARISYAREILGDRHGAIDAMRLAVDAGGGTGEPLAWSLVQLGNLYFDTGRLGAARQAYERALTAMPGYVHAQAALGRLAAARGNYPTAISRYRRAVARLPLPQYEGALGDVLRLSGRGDDASEAYGAVDAIERLFEANGVITDLETALFDLDHDRRLGDALARAQAAYREGRKSIDAEDVLAWAFYKNGRCGEARAHSVRALRLGTRDALKLFHRGMVELCLGHPEAGRGFLRQALALNPHFSLLYAPVARRALR